MFKKWRHILDVSGDAEKETLGFSLIYNKLKMQSFQTVLHDVIGVWDGGVGS